MALTALAAVAITPAMVVVDLRRTDVRCVNVLDARVRRDTDAVHARPPVRGGWGQCGAADRGEPVDVLHDDRRAPAHDALDGESHGATRPGSTVIIVQSIVSVAIQVSWRFADLVDLDATPSSASSRTGPPQIEASTPGRKSIGGSRRASCRIRRTRR